MSSVQFKGKISGASGSQAIQVAAFRSFGRPRDKTGMFKRERITARYRSAGREAQRAAELRSFDTQTHAPLAFDHSVCTV